jgi:hypothetical protein
MDLPRWNNEWDPPDPLKGRLGWSRRHYVTGMMFMIVLAGLAGIAIPFVLQCWNLENRLDRERGHQSEYLEMEVERTTRQP